MAMEGGAGNANWGRRYRNGRFDVGGDRTGHRLRCRALFTINQAVGVEGTPDADNDAAFESGNRQRPHRAVPYGLQLAIQGLGSGELSKTLACHARSSHALAAASRMIRIMAFRSPSERIGQESSTTARSCESVPDSVPN